MDGERQEGRHQQRVKGCCSEKVFLLFQKYMEVVQSLGKGGESAFIFIQSYLITSKTHMLEIIFAGA